MENLNSCEFLEGLSCYQPFEHITCHLTTFRRPNWPIVSLLFMNGNGWREAAFIVYFSHDIDTWFVFHSKRPPSKITLKPLSCFDITTQRGCNILISYMVLDSENAISRASFVQVPSYRSARRQMNHVFCSVRLTSILKFRPYLRATVSS